MDAPLSRIFKMELGELEIVGESSDSLPNLRCTLPAPAREAVSIVLRVLSRSGIPLAQASAQVKAGDTSFETTRWEILAMEGYAHLDRASRLAVERRVWSRCTRVIGSAA
jgi:hypothetical protein